MKALTLIMLGLSLSLPGFAQESVPQGAKDQGMGAIVESKNDPMDSSIEQAGHDAFLKAPGLSDEQRNKLAEVMKETMKQAGQIKLEIASQKVDLFDALIQVKPDSKKIKEVKKKIIDLDQKRLTVMFKAMDEVQKIIGRNPETTKYLRSFMFEHLSPGRKGL